MVAMKGLRDCSGLAVLCFVLAAGWETVSGQIRYSIAEEIQKGSFVGNLAKDLELDLQGLSDRGVKITTEGRKQYFDLNFKSGHLYISERVDREEICGRSSKCLLRLEVLVQQQQMKLHEVEIEITDINDNAPRFQVEQIEIGESTDTGTRFLLPDARDPDVETNSLQGYHLSDNKHFSLDVQKAADGARYAELVLEKALDREEQAVHNLLLTATDGGDPVRSGTAHIRVIVEDANDNPPVFSQPLYKASVLENVPRGSVLVTVNATDRDEGINSEVTYSFRKITEKASQIFLLDPKSGALRAVGEVDFEESPKYEMEVQAQDGRGLSARSKVLLLVLDVNDNAPEIALTSLAHSVEEGARPGTVIAVFNAQDPDSGQNGEVTCSIPSSLPLRLQKSFDNYYSLVTDRALDREQVSEYNVTITATDRGNPPLSTITALSLKILDKNDNPPTFTQTSYTGYITENNPIGASILSLEASDPDWGENARVTYSLLLPLLPRGEGSESPVSSSISIHSESGAVYALRSFDYEQLRELRFQVQAQDGGSPPLSTNVSVTLWILDQNDNSPEILYPASRSDGSTGVELAPRSSEPGYLVTKVVAVDADSGQNAWLSYQLLKATEPGLFRVGLQSGEIRTARSVLDKDALKQSLVVLVKDNGQPPLSASVSVTVVLADSLPQILSELSSLSASAAAAAGGGGGAEPQPGLTLYLVIAVASVSGLFFSFLLGLLALRLRRWRNSPLLESGASGNFSGVPVSQFVGIDGVRAFLHSYSQEASLTAGSRKSQILFPVVSCTNTLTAQQPQEKPAPPLRCDDSNISNGGGSGDGYAAAAGGDGFVPVSTGASPPPSISTPGASSGLTDYFSLNFTSGTDIKIGLPKHFSKLLKPELEKEAQARHLQTEGETKQQLKQLIREFEMSMNGTGAANPPPPNSPPSDQQPGDGNALSDEPQNPPPTDQQPGDKAQTLNSRWPD
uniref:Cadherin domain-containing protein n=1 Tax=Sphenodon punctatus TaxID=8508 RepID=A0A8D0HFQ6_SPHPU